MAKLTACLISANRAEQLKIAIDSLLNQSYQDFEIILSDDSVDDSIKDYFLAKFPSGKYIHHNPPLGEIANTNFVINSAETEYVLLCHDDDYFDKSYIEECFLRMLANKDVDLCYSGRIIINPDNKVITQNLMLNSNVEFLYESNNILDVMLYDKVDNKYRVPINTPGLFLKKHNYVDVNGLNPKVNTHCDTEFLLKILSVTNSVLYINKPIYYSRLWNNSSGRSKSSEKCEVFEAQLGVLEYFCNFKKSPPFSLLEKQYIYKKYALRCCNFNGPMLWMALRSKYGFWRTKQEIFNTANKMIKLNKMVIYKPKFYINFLVALLFPQFIIIKLQKKFTALLNTKR